MERGEVGARRRGRPAGELVRGVCHEGHGVEEALEGPGDGRDPAPRGLRGGAGAGAAGGGGLCGCGLGGCHCIVWRWWGGGKRLLWERMVLLVCWLGE